MNPTGALRRFDRLGTTVVDTVIALVLAAIPMIEIATSDCPCATPADRWWSAAFVVTMTLPLTLRRRYPFAVLNVVGLTAFVYNLLDIPPDPYTVTFALLLAVYTVSAYARRQLAIVAAVVSAVALIVLNVTALAEEQDFADVVNNFVLFAAAWIVGDNTRRRRREAELLNERAERAERERAEAERIAVLEERGRLAREIHDVIAHSVGVIAVQAGTARAVAEERPDRAREALAAIEHTSKGTLTELRRTLGALRGPGDDAALAPAPRLDDLDELIDQVRRLGLSVSVLEVGRPVSRPPAVDLSAFRVVQEALTNAVKHAGRTAARVTIRYGDGWLEVAVDDDGPPTPRSQGNGDGGGHGLIGMRERVAVLGGEFEAGRRGPGFAVRARFPMAGEPS